MCKLALVSLLSGGWVVQAACARNFMREVEVLLAPLSNPLALQNSFLVNAFGPQILFLFNNF